MEWEATLTRAPKQTGELAVLRTNLGEEITLQHGRLLRSKVAASALTVEPMTGSAAWPEWTIAGPPRLSYVPPTDGAFARGRDDHLRCKRSPAAP